MDNKFFQRLFPSSASPPRSSQNATLEAVAERGDADAQFKMGLHYGSAGPGQNYSRAEYWYLKAAAQKHPLAHYNLGVLYGNGQCGPRDWAKSLSWIQKAADLGSAPAQYHLGIRHHRAAMNYQTTSDKESEQISQSRMDAYVCFRLAQAQGYPGAEAAGNLVSLSMTHQQVAEAGRRIAALKTAVQSPVLKQN